MTDTRIMKAARLFLFLVVATLIQVEAIPASAQSYQLAPDCHEDEYNSLLQKHDAFVNAEQYRVAEQTAYRAANLRFKCANNAKNDIRASYLDDFAGQMEIAMGDAAHIKDDAGACALLRADRQVLKEALESSTLSQIWKKTLVARRENALIYKGACGIVNGHYAI